MGAPESWARCRWTDGQSAKKGKRSPSVIPEFKLLGKEGGKKNQNEQSRQFHGINTKSLYKLL